MRPSLKISVILWLVFLLLCLGYGIARLRAFLRLFFEHAGLAITQDEVALNASSVAGSSREQVIPKILHQVFHNWRDPGNDTLPEDWNKVRQTCIAATPGWEHMLWTEKASRDFIEAEYPWFLKTYDGYRFPVQRVDAVRYFLLLHYGGIYLDLDNTIFSGKLLTADWHPSNFKSLSHTLPLTSSYQGCKADLTPLLYYPVWITDGGRGALSNNVLASRPHHPFWSLLTNSLVTYNYDYFFPYVTISYASGQWFETEIWEKYHALLPPIDQNTRYEHRLYRLMMDDRPEADPWVFFTQERGGSWKNWDNDFFLWIGDHVLLIFLVVSIVTGVPAWIIYRRRKHRGYTKLRNQAERNDIELFYAQNGRE